MIVTEDRAGHARTLVTTSTAFRGRFSSSSPQREKLVEQVAELRTSRHASEDLISRDAYTDERAYGKL